MYPKAEKTGKVMFLAKEVAELWGHSNSRQAIKDSELKQDEVLVLGRREWKEFFDFVCKQNLLSNKTHRITLITESGLYKLALNSRKPRGYQSLIIYSLAIKVDIFSISPLIPFAEYWNNL